MSSIKEHLVGVHERLAKHHGAVSGHYQDMADCMGKAANDEATKAKSSLEALSGEHADMAEFHQDCAAKCAKAAVNELDKMVPTRVSAVVPDMPAGLRRVPRPGQPQEASVKPNVPLEFEKLFSVEDY